MDIPKKSLGQHWLDDNFSLDEICLTADIRPNDVVLEIGPGPGSLTERLLDRAGRVVAVEFDHDLARKLASRFSGSNLEVIAQDILRFDFDSLPANYKIVANIPYYLTSNLLRMLSESSNPPSMAVLLLQKEVAQRVCAQPGNMSILAISVQLYFETSLGLVVPAELFTPPPKIDSQLLILHRRQEPLFTDINYAKFFKVVKAGFSERRKKLRSSLSGGLRIDKNQAENLLKFAGINPDMRAQELSLEQWYELSQKL